MFFETAIIRAIESLRKQKLVRYNGFGYSSKINKNKRVNMTMKEAIRQIYESYNNYIEVESERILSSAPQNVDLYSKDYHDYFQKALDDKTDAYFDRPIDILQGRSPNEYFGLLATVEDCVDAFMIGAEVCDDVVPKGLLNRLLSFGENAVVRLLDIALAEDWHIEKAADTMDAREAISGAMSAIKVLGRIGANEAVEPLLERYGTLISPDEYIADIIQSFLQDIGEPAVASLLMRINGVSHIPAHSAEEDYVVALSQIGAQVPDEIIYQALRSAFKKLERKLIGVLCFGDYGDSRAVTLLKNYLDRNQHALTRDIFYEAMSVIQKLGGDINDIRDPFKDFSK